MSDVPGRVDDVTLLVVLRVKQHDDAPEIQTVNIDVEMHAGKTSHMSILFYKKCN